MCQIFCNLSVCVCVCVWLYDDEEVSKWGLTSHPTRYFGDNFAQAVQHKIDVEDFNDIVTKN